MAAIEPGKKAFALLLLACLVAASAGAESLSERLDRAGAAWASSLRPEARAEAGYDFEDEERFDVHFAPIALEGLRLDAMTEAERSLVDELLAVVLSKKGLERVRHVRELEAAVGAMEGFPMSLVAPWFRDAGRYFVALFGEPGDGAWGLRLEGHHLSLNLTRGLDGSPPTLTPFFLGAQPRIVPEGLPNAGLQLLREEEELAGRLIASLSSEQRSTAALAYQDGRGHMLSQVDRALPTEAPAGVLLDALAPEQQTLADELLGALLSDFHPDIRSGFTDRSRRAELRFTYTRSAENETLLYFRLDGPDWRLEFDNTTDGDHIHTVLRSFAGDFGLDRLAGDPLARHLALEHARPPTNRQ